MKSAFYHVKLNVSDVGFYKSLLIYLGFNITGEYSEGFGATDGNVSIWVFKVTENHKAVFNYLSNGLNHLAFRVEKKELVDNFYQEYLQSKGVSVLFEPSEHPHYNNGKGYYAVFFEDTDGIKLEVACVAE